MGAESKCQAGDVEVTAGLAVQLIKTDDLPFRSVEQVAETILSRAGL